VSIISQFTQPPTKGLVASFQVAHRLAKSKKPHAIAEEVILAAAAQSIF